MITVHTATERRPDGAAFLVAAGLAALGALLIWQAGTIPDKSGYAGVGSGGVPKFVGYGLFALALGHVVTALRHGTVGRLRPQLVPVFWVVGGLALQLFLLRPLGFSMASGLLFTFTAAGFGRRKLVMTLPIGVAFSAGIYGVFDQVLKLKLPAGLLENLMFGG